MKKIFIKRWFKNYLFLLINFILVEVLFTFIDGSSLSISMTRIVAFNSLLAVIFSFFTSFAGYKLNKVLNAIIVFIVSFYAFIQLGFNNFLGVYASLNTSTQLGAVTDYIREFLLSFKWTYYLELIPFVLSVIFLIVIKSNLKNDFKERKLILRILLFIILTGASVGIYYGTLKAKFLQNKFQTISDIDLFTYPDPPTMAVRQLGITAFGITDVKNYFVPAKVAEQEITEYKKKKQVKNDYTREIDDRAMEAVIANEKNSNLNSMNKYFISQDITPKNKLTGEFEGKNLIIIMMESANDIFINEEYFPNFYKLYNEGWHWKNNYSPRNSCSTGNNELSGLISQYSIYNFCTANYYKRNTYFISLFNLFNNAGYYTTSYHNYTDSYYARRIIHPNLGSQKFYDVRALKIPYQGYYRDWSSDADLMDAYLKIVDTFEEGKPFMSWITTVSGHQPYSVSSILGDKYLNDFRSTGYPTDIKRYMSKLKELDKGLGILLDGLEERGILDDTVIVLYGDHYPYGISKNHISKVLDYNLDDYEVERVPFIIYNSAEMPQERTEYTSYMNILPTLANLFNLDYDPRYYMGHDLFDKDYENKVVFADGSWKNDKVYYNAANGKLKVYEEGAYTDEEIMKITQTIRDQINISNKAIKNNYFEYLGKKLEQYAPEPEPEETLVDENGNPIEDPNATGEATEN